MSDPMQRMGEVEPYSGGEKKVWCDLKKLGTQFTDWAGAWWGREDWFVVLPMDYGGIGVVALAGQIILHENGLEASRTSHDATG